ncbi:MULTISPECIES: hypothetical protein [Psychrilyobacter]|uniref:Uncharacterized protein n=1 Tax=Psychrilyobacter piezotolerans TaxID=2293438 RepID=A0ABX9KJ95_9FUSO|nr:MULTISPECIES: hypothetical protein [Psychrilyobacter]MCS5422197.1 hypothetical protein [Psychrilyobacter sp. S5]NDI77156.1 hypothetical protein [Psychrilyobacter piezotolerans]RDE64148.1 hypothetical protein DV867_04255 [Psychrilyobacter sp. S5]REI42240.1 hypothetical protein DYH56_04255 [Psychrilyobacter piezotolerans]
MARKKKFSPGEKRKILEEIKLLWEGSEKITYRELEEIQKQKWKQIVYKAGTLRNYAYKDEWNRNKGQAVEENREEVKNDLIKTVHPEVLEKVEESEDHSLIMTGLGNKYRSDFDKAREKLSQAIDEEDIQRVKFSNEAFKALSRARKTDLELMGILDVADQKKIEVELFKLEMIMVDKAIKTGVELDDDEQS